MDAGRVEPVGRFVQRAIDEALETVDLLPVGNRLVRNYSSGMKQRLGIVEALLVG